MSKKPVTAKKANPAAKSVKKITKPKKTTKPANKAVKPAKKEPVVAKKPVKPVEKAAPMKKIPVQAGGKRRLVVSYKNLTQDVLDAIKEKYPHGYNDYMADIMKVDKPDGSYFYAITIDLPGATYLVKIDVKVDTDYEEVEKEIFGGGPENTGDDNNDFPDAGEDSSDFSDDVDDDDE
jgi:hypothetical protein